MVFILMQKGRGGVGMESRDWLELIIENMGYGHIWYCE